MTWMTQRWTGGQLNALVKIHGEQTARDILSGKRRIQTAKNKHLGNRQEIHWREQEDDEVKEFYDNPSYFVNDDIYFTSDFRKRILSSLSGDGQSIVPRLIMNDHSISDSTLVSFDVASESSEFEIRGELSEFHIFENPLTFCTYLKQMLMDQINGQNGTLLINGGSNLFFVQGIEEGLFVVNTRFELCVPDEGWSEKERWVINARGEGGYHPFLESSHRWMPDHGVRVRVFDRNERADSDKI